mgnify:CR=1 FL=1
MPDGIPLMNVGVVFAITFLVTFIATPLIGRELKRRGIAGKDVHKPSKDELPEMCGLAIMLGLAIGAASILVLYPKSSRETIAFLGTVLIAGGIGIIDDIRPLGPRIKPVLTAIASLPILVLGTYNARPIIPLVGEVRLTIVYVLLIPIAIAVTANAVNMMDVMNGSMSGTVGIISLAVTAILLFSGNVHPAMLAVGLFAALLAFHYYNRFPAKVFSGDTGSLAVGAALGALSILGRIETVMIVALIPHIMNAFYGLSSVGRLYERREIRERPTILLDDGKLQASANKSAPVTLTRLILAAGPAGENDVVHVMMILTLASSILATLTYWIMLVGAI